MSVHKKLMQARIELQSTQLKKSGLNKFAGYSYFELGDFLPTIQAIFHRVGLCGVVSYTAEMATLTIVDTEDATVITVTSPMAEANLKGTHPIQNLGAVETYQRRYLWMTAMEIVEHDILDASTGFDMPRTKPVQASKPEPKPEPKPDPRLEAPKSTKTQTTAGKPGPWQITLHEREDGDWATAILDATDIALQVAASSEDVQNIFKANRVHYDRLKEETPTIYDDLLAMLKKAKLSFTQD
jgi:hypothetical protein